MNSRQFSTLKRCLFNALLMTLSTAAVADNAQPLDLTDLSLEELLTVEVISAPRLSQKNSQAPASIEVLTASDIRTFGWRTLAEALNSIRGLFTTNNRNYNFLGVRGFMHKRDFNSRILVMVDGQRMNENYYDSGFIGQEFMLDVELIDRIEYVPGSGSSIYGANAYSGMINVITKKAKQINGSQISGEIGTFDNYKGRVSVGKTLDNGDDVLASASHYDSSGVEKLYFPEFDTPDQNHGIAQNMDTERADRLFGKWRHQDLEFSAGYVQRFKRVPTAAYGTAFNNPLFTTKDTQFFGNATWEKTLNNQSSMRVKGFYQGYDYSGAFPYADGNVDKEQVTSRWWGGDIQFTTTAFQHQRLIAGLEYQYDQRQHYLAAYSDSNHNNRGHRVELYIQDDLQLPNNLTFTVGGRLDYHHMLKNLQVNPRVGLIWNPNPQTDLKLLYSSTFRAPNIAEVYYSNIANNTLKEEHINSYEAVAEWRSNNHLRLIATLFHNDMTSLLAISNNSDYENCGHYRAYGGELQAEQRWDNGRLLKASYTYNLLTNEAEDGRWAVASPQNLVKLHYAEPLFDNLAKLGIESVFVDQRQTFQYGMADGYYQLNLNLSSDKLIPGTDVSFAVYNLLDSHYQMLGGTANDISQEILRMNGRELRLKLQVTF